MTLKERITQFIEYKGITRAAFEQKCGLSNAYTRNIKDNLGSSKLEDILRAFPELNRVWLLTGVGEMLNSQARPVEISEAAASADKGYKSVPIVHIDSVGGMHSPNAILTPEYVEGYIYLPDAREGDLAIYQSGNSMAPAIPSGALLQIREVPDWREYIGYGDVFVLLLRDERRITKEIRRYEEDPKNYYWCVSYNPDVADEELPKKFVRRVFKVIKVLIDKGW